MPPEPMRAMLVEDEPLARAALRQELAAHAQVRIVAEASNLAQARRLLATQAPDLLLLDAELGDGCGLELLEGAAPTLRAIVVSAHESYALRAFEVAAQDYLLKPVDGARLARALARVLAANAGDAGSVAALGYDDCLFLAPDGAIRFLRVAELSALRAHDEGSLLLLCDGRSVASPRPLQHWEARLPSAAFVRIHRSALINLRRVRRIESWFEQRFRVHLEGVAQPLAMSRRCALALRRRFG
jgi:two-component system LytT family response regulator